jgi:hypothetical protein
VEGYSGWQYELVPFNSAFKCIMPPGTACKHVEESALKATSPEDICPIPFWQRTRKNKIKSNCRGEFFFII